MYPPTSHPLDCIEGSVWNHPEPCCALTCPPDIYANVGIFVDGSDNLTPEVFAATKAFVNRLLEGLRIEIEESALYAVMSDIRKDNMIQMDDHRDMADLLVDYDTKVQRHGRPVDTFNMLFSITKHMFLTRERMRKNANKILAIFTSGNFVGRDSPMMQMIKSHLEKQDIMVIVVLVPGAKKDADKNQFWPGLVDSVTSKRLKGYVMPEILEEGFEMGVESVIENFREALCSNPCSNAFHNI